jgi:hypothetical protein
MEGCMHATQTSAVRVYRPRKPRTTALYRCAAAHAPELKAGGRYGRRVEEKIIERFLACGDPQHGFARICCGQCRYACILAFSCKANPLSSQFRKNRMVARR